MKPACLVSPIITQRIGGPYLISLGGSFPLTIAEWWIIPIPVLLGIFAIIIASYVASRYLGLVEERRYSALTGMDPNDLGQNPLETTTLEQNLLDPTIVRTRANLGRWSRIATRAYVAMVLACAAFYMGPLFLGLGMSVWYSLMVYSFPFLSAFFVYRVWSKVREE